MMGRQINFFLLGEDEKELYDFVLNNGDTIINDIAQTISYEIVVQNPYRQVFVKLPQSSIKKYKESNFIDVFKSSLLEINRTWIREKRIEAGRLYVDLFYFDSNNMKQKKGKWLEDRFAYYKKWIIKHSKISINKGYYIGNYTYKLYKEKGFQMVGSFAASDKNVILFD
jgi:hypothetical protein